MKKIFFTILLFVFLRPINLPAQLNLLTEQEVLSIIDRIPDVANALKGGCPFFSSTNWDVDTVSVQVRYGCGPYNGQLIGNYQVNKSNGETTGGWENRLPVLDTEGEIFAKRLVVQAQKRILSLDEAKCLVKEAAKTLSEWKDDNLKISVKTSDNITLPENTAIFIATENLATYPASRERVFKVNLKDMKIYSNDTDISLMSPYIDNLVSRLFELRVPLWLSKEEIEVVISTVPQIADAVTNDCTPYAYYESPYRSVAGVGCRSSVSVANVYVNPQTGEITDQETGELLDTYESKQIARQFFDQKLLHSAKLQKEIETICKP